MSFLVTNLLISRCLPNFQSFIQNARIGNFVSGNSCPEKTFICVTQKEEEKSSGKFFMNKEALCRKSYEMMESFREFERNFFRKKRYLKTKHKMY